MSVISVILFVIMNEAYIAQIDLLKENEID